MDLDIQKYLDRIGFKGKTEISLTCLTKLQQCHQRSVPFENLDIFTNRKKLLNHKHLYEQIVVNNRGGWCHELNGLFSWLLSELGFDNQVVNRSFIARYQHIFMSVNSLPVFWPRKTEIQQTFWTHDHNCRIGRSKVSHWCWFRQHSGTFWTFKVNTKISKLGAGAISDRSLVTYRVVCRDSSTSVRDISALYTGQDDSVNSWQLSVSNPYSYVSYYYSYSYSYYYYVTILSSIVVFVLHHIFICICAIYVLIFVYALYMYFYLSRGPTGPKGPPFSGRRPPALRRS